MRELADRRAYTAAKLKELQQELQKAEALAKNKACIYATGSFGRGEASRHSDLDLFIVGKTDEVIGAEDKQGSLLNRLDEICIKANLIEVTRKLGIPDFSGAGRYLVHYSVDDFTKTLGTDKDDVTNTFTARLLLLLESYPLVEREVYEEVIKEVVDAYWRDYGDHKGNFMPAFLANDILRLWRTLCVNYEANTKDDPPREKAKRKLKNYKLKHSRLLTCYSAILYLLATYHRRKTVTPLDAMDMIKLTPTQRLQWLQEQADLAEAHPTIDKLFERYDSFLLTTSVGEQELIDKFLDGERSRKYIKDAYEFGNSMFEALTTIGKGDHFYRLLVV